jgi:uncharacterized spore protein YtfJ
MRILDQVKEVVGGANVFGQAYDKDGLTLIPAFRVSGGGGGGQDAGPDAAAGGGVGMQARPVGAFVIKGSDVSWIPAVDVTRVILGGQMVMLAALFTLRTIVRVRARRRWNVGAVGGRRWGLMPGARRRWAR